MFCSFSLYRLFATVFFLSIFVMISDWGFWGGERGTFSEHNHLPGKKIHDFTIIPCSCLGCTDPAFDLHPCYCLYPYQMNLENKLNNTEFAFIYFVRHTVSIVNENINEVRNSLLHQIQCQIYVANSAFYRKSCKPVSWNGAFFFMEGCLSFFCLLVVGLFLK